MYHVLWSLECTEGGIFMKSGNFRKVSKKEMVIHEILEGVKTAFNSIPARERKNFSSVHVNVKEEPEWVRIVSIVEMKTRDMLPRERDYSHIKLFKDSDGLKTFHKSKYSIMDSVMHFAEKEGYSSWEDADGNTEIWVFTKIE